MDKVSCSFFESCLTPEDVYLSASLACLQMIKSGTTAFADAGGAHMDQAACSACFRNAGSPDPVYDGYGADNSSVYEGAGTKMH